MESYLEATGKTIDAAIQNALKELGMDRDNVSVEVLEQPKSGFFGIGAAPARIKVSYSVSNADKAEEFLIGLLKRMGSTAQTVAREEPDGTVKVEFVGAGLGFLIGHRGDTLDAIQHLTNYVVNRGEVDSFRVDVDAENYREKRVEALRRLAKKTGDRVLQTRRSTTLESMNAYERHIIHSAFQDVPGLSTHSVGVEPNRRVVISCVRAPGERPPVDNRSVGRQRLPDSGGGARPPASGWRTDKPGQRQGGPGQRPGSPRPFGGPRQQDSHRPSGGSRSSGDHRSPGNLRPPVGQSPRDAIQGGRPGGSPLRPANPGPAASGPPPSFGDHSPRPYERVTRTGGNAPASGDRTPQRAPSKPPFKRSSGDSSGPRPYDRLPRE